MSNAARNIEALKALKKFNTAITTIRLYPSSTPQVSNSVEKAFQAIKLYLKKHGILSFSNVDGPSLCGVPINQKTLGKIEGFEFFQQLELLQLNHLVFQSGLHKDTFHQLLDTFTTSPQIITSEGGIRPFLASLNLNELFPEKYAVVAEGAEVNQFAEYLSQHASDVERWQQYIDCLTGETKNDSDENEIKDLIQDPVQAAKLLNGIIASIFLDIDKKKDATRFSPLFPQVMEGLGLLLDNESIQDTVAETASSLLRNFKDSALADIVVQDFPKGFGEALFADILLKIGVDSFDKVIKRLRQLEKSMAALHGRASQEYRVLLEKSSRLLDSPKGKQFLSHEKTKGLLESAEWERRAKRIQAGLSSILKGNIAVLQNDEIVEHLPSSIDHLIANGKDDAAAAIIEHLAKELIKENSKTDDRLSKCLSVVGEKLIHAKKWDWLENLAIPFLSWVRKGDHKGAACEKILHILHSVMLHAWKTGSNVRADQILNVFFNIRTGGLKKSPEMIALVEKVQEQSVDMTLLHMFLKQALSESADEMARARLSRQGTFAAKFLMSTLLESDKIADRMKLLELLADMGEILPPLLVERLLEPMPWYGKRNLIKLLTDTGNEEHVATVIRYINHDDLRVQREAFICLYKISGERRKEVLLEVLSIAGEQMKVQTVKALVPYTDDDVAAEMVGLLQARDNFSLDLRSVLIVEVGQILSQCSPKIALNPLKELQQSRGKGGAKKLDERVWDVVDDALVRLKTRARMSKISQQLAESEESAIDGKRSELHGDAQIQTTITGFPEESEARYLFERGKKEKALQILTKMIARSARLKQFDQAEKLREWLIEMAPMALGEIIKAAEIIEEEKQSGIDKGHLAIWSKLYDVLTTEEFNAFYYALQHKRFGTDEPIIQQGDMRSCLYFINSGKLKLFYRDHGNEILVTTIGAGEVMGASSFFDASVWTINVSSINRVEVSILKLSKTLPWKKEFPALETKLQDFCAQFETVHESFEKPGKDRREEERFQLSGILALNFYDREGKNSQTSTKGEIADVSAGGVSFILRISQKTNARLLLGRKVRVMLPSARADESGFVTEGMVVAVRSLKNVGNDYSLHIKFNQTIDAGELQDIVAAGQEKV